MKFYQKFFIRPLILLLQVSLSLLLPLFTEHLCVIPNSCMLKDVGYMTDDRNSKTPSDSEGMLVSKCVDELSRTLTSSIKQLEDRINVCATKKELEDFCSSPTVASIIEDRIKSAPLQKGNEGDKGDVENTEDGGNTAIEEKPITRRESRTKLLHMAMSRIGKVEELVSMLTEELQKVESLLDLKSDKINEDVIAKLNTKIKQLTGDIMKQQPSNEEFSGMKNHIEKINSESKALKFKTEQSFKEQTEVCKKVHKLEIELGHLTEYVYKRFGKSSAAVHYHDKFIYLLAPFFVILRQGCQIHLH